MNIERKGTPLNEVELRFLDLPSSVQGFIKAHDALSGMRGILPADMAKALQHDRDRYNAIVTSDPKLNEVRHSFMEFRDQFYTEKAN